MSTTTERGSGQAGRQARRAEDSRGVEIAARLGLAGRGLVYVLIGVLAVQVALGQSSEKTDREGALRQIADKPFGTAVLVLLVIGFAGYAVWRGLEAAVGRRDETDEKKRTVKRIGSAARAVVYGAIAVSTAVFIASDGSKGGSSGEPAPWSARLMTHTGGRWLVGAAGVVVIGIGVALAVRGARAKFLKKLKTGEMRGRTRTVVTVLGRVGQTARGAVFALAGVFLVKAAWQFDPKEAKGLDGTLKTLAGQAYGQWLLGAAAVGLIAFGLYSFAEARYRRI